MELKLYEIKVYKWTETDWDDEEVFIGTYYTHAKSPKQAWSRIKYRYKFYTKYYESSNVRYRAEYKEIDKTVKKEKIMNTTEKKVEQPKKEVTLVCYFMRLTNGDGGIVRIPEGEKDVKAYVKKNFIEKLYGLKTGIEVVDYSNKITDLIEVGDLVSLTYDDIPKYISKISEDRSHITFVDHSGAEGALMTQVRRLWFASKGERPSYKYIARLKTKEEAEQESAKEMN